MPINRGWALCCNSSALTRREDLRLPVGREELRFQTALPFTVTASTAFCLTWPSLPCKGLTNSYKCLSWVNKSNLWEKHHISKNVRSPKKWNVITLTKIWSCSSGPRNGSAQITFTERLSSFPCPVPAFGRRRKKVGGRKKNPFKAQITHLLAFCWLPHLAHTHGQAGSTPAASYTSLLLL